MRVVVIPEDHRRDGVVLKPIIEAMLRRCGDHPKVAIANVEGGYSRALDRQTVQDVIIEFGPYADLFLLCVDRDCDENRHESITRIEQLAQEELDPNQAFLGEHAWQEVEVWILAGMQDIPKHWRWKDIREEREAKEVFYQPYARMREVSKEVNEGREILAKEAARRYTRIRQLCPEDVARLEDRIRQWMENRA